VEDCRPVSIIIILVGMAETDHDLPTAFDTATCVRKGLCPVMAVRGQDTSPVESHSLYFGQSLSPASLTRFHRSPEQHGTGPNKVVLIMGLNSSSFSWGNQVELLAKHNSVLVLDNRGVGNSSTPRGPYSYAFFFLPPHNSTFS
jgi:pimeloyl-ACP methyl ester carboxylesterase